VAADTVNIEADHTAVAGTAVAHMVVVAHTMSDKAVVAVDIVQVVYYSPLVSLV
jgi:hypothetical protein